MLLNLKISISTVSKPMFTSFECLVVLRISALQSTVIATDYRPPKIKESSMSEFANLLSMVCLRFKRILILGYFNIHTDQTNSKMAKDF